MKKAIFKAVSMFVVITLLSFSESNFVAHAQTLSTSGTASIDGIDIQSNPSSPTPGSSVTVSVVSYSTDLSAANISWNVGGKNMTKGTGMESITVTAPAAGKTLQVLATIQTAQGANVQKVITIGSGDVDMVSEASGYVPPLYKGKVPFAYQGSAEIIAVPHLSDKNGNAIDPKNLIYQWKENTFVLGNMSGYGKQSITVAGSVVAQPLYIDVTVSSIDGSAHAEGQITLNPIAPSILFYQDDPLYGVLYNTAIGQTLRLVHNQTKVVATPYGFNIPGAGFVYNWSLNGSTDSGLSTSRSIILGVNGAQKGSSNVDLNIQNTAEDILQTAESSFTAIFANQANATTSNALF